MFVWERSDAKVTAQPHKIRGSPVAGKYISLAEGITNDVNDGSLVGPRSGVRSGSRALGRTNRPTRTCSLYVKNCPTRLTGHEYLDISSVATSFQLELDRTHYA